MEELHLKKQILNGFILKPSEDRCLGLSYISENHPSLSGGLIQNPNDSSQSKAPGQVEKLLKESSIQFFFELLFRIKELRARP